MGRRDEATKKDAARPSPEPASRARAGVAACPACGAVLFPPTRPACGACGMEFGALGAVPERRPRLDDAERAAAAADRKRVARSVTVVSAVCIVLVVLLYALAKRA